jgi:hypothetical protein
MGTGIAPCRYLDAMSLASVQDIAAIHAAADPWLRIRSFKQARDGGGLYPEGPYSFEAEVKVHPDAPLDAEFGSAAAAHNVRVHLISRAEEALEALAVAGYHLTAAPHMELAGRLTRLPAAADGKPVPPLQHDISLKLWFEVDRAYSTAERAMDPKVVADEIIDTWARGERPWNG